MYCLEKGNQERIFLEMHGKTKDNSGEVGFYLAFPCFRCGKSEDLRNYKPCVRGQVGGSEKNCPGADERGLSAQHGHTCTHIHIHRHPVLAPCEREIGFKARTKILNTLVFFWTAS